MRKTTSERRFHERPQSTDASVKMTMDTV